jgi:hypothetical protein
VRIKQESFSFRFTYLSKTYSAKATVFYIPDKLHFYVALPEGKGSGPLEGAQTFYWRHAEKAFFWYPFATPRQQAFAQTISKSLKRYIGTHPDLISSVLPEKVKRRLV